MRAQTLGGASTWGRGGRRVCTPRGEAAGDGDPAGPSASGLRPRELWESKRGRFSPPVCGALPRRLSRPTLGLQQSGYRTSHRYRLDNYVTDSASVSPETQVQWAERRGLCGSNPSVFYSLRLPHPCQVKSFLPRRNAIIISYRDIVLQLRFSLLEKKEIKLNQEDKCHLRTM